MLRIINESVQRDVFEVSLSSCLYSQNIREFILAKFEAKHEKDVALMPYIKMRTMNNICHSLHKADFSSLFNLQKGNLVHHLHVTSNDIYLRNIQR